MCIHVVDVFSCYSRQLLRSLGEAGEIEPETASVLTEYQVDDEEFPQEVLDCLPKLEENKKWTAPQVHTCIIQTHTIIADNVMYNHSCSATECTQSVPMATCMYSMEFIKVIIHCTNMYSVITCATYMYI